MDYLLIVQVFIRIPSTDQDLIPFTYEFVDAISEPVEHDGTAHIEYVPTQVLGEFFAQSFTYAKRHKLDGTMFPSALLPKAQNLVLFPVWGTDNPEWAKLAQLVGSQQAVAP